MFVCPAEAARRCGIPLRKLIAEGPPAVIIGRRRFYDQETLAQWLTGRAVTIMSPPSCTATNASVSSPSACKRPAIAT